jgi:ankyrin repeat protein
MLAKDRDYIALKSIRKEAENKIADFKEIIFCIQSSSTIREDSLPESTKETFSQITDQLLPAIKKAKGALDAALEEWHDHLYEVTETYDKEKIKDYTRYLKESDSKGRFLLHMLLEKDSWEADAKALDFIAKRSININAKDNTGTTPLHIALKKIKDDPTSLDNVRQLLKNGADPNISLSDGTTPLLDALGVKQEESESSDEDESENSSAEESTKSKGSSDSEESKKSESSDSKESKRRKKSERTYALMCMLLEYGANPNTIHYKTGDIPLSCVLKRPDEHQPEKISKLLSHGADINSLGLKTLLDDTKKQQEQVEAYLKLPVKEMDYFKLKLLREEIRKKITVFKDRFGRMNKFPTKLRALLPSPSGDMLFELISNQMPAIKRHKKLLYKEHKSWIYKVSQSFGLTARSNEEIEAYLEKIYKPDLEGSLLIHDWAELDSPSASYFNSLLNSFLIEKTLDINCKNKKGLTPMHILVNHLINKPRKRDTEKLSLLFNHKADINIKFPDGSAPLLHAIRRSSEKATRFLLEKGADPNMKSMDGTLPLFQAMKSKKNDFVRLLLEKGADPNTRFPDGTAPLCYALEENFGESYSSTMYLLLDKGADPNTKFLDGKTPLCYTLKGYYECTNNPIIKSAIADKANNKKVESDKKTAYSSILLSLLEKRADPNTRFSNGNTPLCYILKSKHKGCPVVVRELLSKGADPNLISLKDHHPPLYYAIKSKDYSTLMSSLLEKGANADIELEKESEIRALMWTITQEEDASERYSKLRILLRYNANPNIGMTKGGFSRYYQDAKGWTPLHAAIERKDMLTLTKLREYGTSASNEADMRSIAKIDCIRLINLLHEDKLIGYDRFVRMRHSCGVPVVDSKPKKNKPASSPETHKSSHDSECSILARLDREQEWEERERERKERNYYRAQKEKAENKTKEENKPNNSGRGKLDWIVV